MATNSGPSGQEIERRLAEMGLPLPSILGREELREIGIRVSLIPWRRAGSLLYLSGTIGTQDGKLQVVGKMGEGVDMEQARQSARLCTLNHLAMVKQAVGDLGKVVQVVKLLGFAWCVDGFEYWTAMNAASELWIDLYGERGWHARSVITVPSMVHDAPIEIEAIVEVRD